MSDHEATLSALDICAGAGGLSEGMRRAGFNVRGLELDPDACDTHRRHVGPCEAADLRTWHPSTPCVLCAGGIPCQPFSMAGARRGLDDPRYLVPDFLRVAREAEAQVILIENVRGLVRDARAFRAVLDLCEAEYHVAWTVLDAADHGVPQHRDRLFIVGFRDPLARARFRWPVATHAPPGELFGKPYVTVRQALNLPPGPHRHGLKEGAKPQSPQGMRMINVDAPAPTIGGSVADLLDRPAPCVTATEHKSAMNGTQPMNRRRRASERLSEALGSLDRPAPTVRANAGHDAPDPKRVSRRPMAELSRAIGDVFDQHRQPDGRQGPGAMGAALEAGTDLAAVEAAGLADRPATTVQTDPRLAVAGHHERQWRGAVRLTPAQCAALQGFPPGWTFTGSKKSQYRQIGNAVPPPLAESVARSIYIAIRPSEAT